MTIKAQVTKITEVGFKVRIHKGNTTLGTKFVSKPSANPAPEYMARGLAMTETEAVAVALRWAGQ